MNIREVQKDNKENSKSIEMSRVIEGNKKNNLMRSIEVNEDLKN